MSALRGEADLVVALADVCKGPKADMDARPASSRDRQATKRKKPRTMPSGKLPNQRRGAFSPILTSQARMSFENALLGSMKKPNRSINHVANAAHHNASSSASGISSIRNDHLKWGHRLPTIKTQQATTPGTAFPTKSRRARAAPRLGKLRKSAFVLPFRLVKSVLSKFLRPLGELALAPGTFFR